MSDEGLSAAQQAVKRGGTLVTLNLEGLQTSHSSIAVAWRWLFDHPDSMVEDVRKMLGITDSRTNVLLKRLHAAGWVTRSGGGFPTEPYRYRASLDGRTEGRTKKARPWQELRDRVKQIERRGRAARHSATIAAMRDALLWIEQEALSIRSELYAVKLPASESGNGTKREEGA